MPSLITIVKILNLKRIFCNNFTLNFRSNDELSPLTTDQTGEYEHQNTPDKNPRGSIRNTEDKRTRLVYTANVYRHTTDKLMFISVISTVR